MPKKSEMKFRQIAQEYIDSAGALEKALLAMLLKRLKTRGIKHNAFAQGVWPDVPATTAISRWLSIRSAGTPISIENAARMAAFFNEDIYYIMSEAYEAVRRDLRATNK